jgi:hypothetical protein
MLSEDYSVRMLRPCVRISLIVMDLNLSLPSFSCCLYVNALLCATPLSKKSYKVSTSDPNILECCALSAGKHLPIEKPLYRKVYQQRCKNLRSSVIGTGYAYSAGRFRFRLRFREPAPVGAKSVLCLTVQVRIVVAGSGGSVQTVGVRRFTGVISSFLFRLSELESEPECARTVRVPRRWTVLARSARGVNRFMVQQYLGRNWYCVGAKFSFDGQTCWLQNLGSFY